MSLEPSAGGTPGTERVNEFGKCAGCALVMTCPSGPNAEGNKRSLVVLTIAGEPSTADEKCENFAAGDQLPGEQKPQAEGADATLQ